MFDSTAFKTDKTVLLKFPEPETIRSVARFVSDDFPEINYDRFNFKDKKGLAEYTGWWPKVRINDRKIIQDVLTIQQIDSTKYQVSVQYRKRYLRPFFWFFTWVLVIGGLATGGILSLFGVGFYFGARESKKDRTEWVQPALERFSAIAKASDKYTAVSA